jgi:uncharacterized protein (DUF433 family)
MKTATNQLIGIGIYAVPEAARLTGIPSARIRRWIRGYRFKARTGYRSSPPVVKGELEHVGGQTALTFLDLLEIRVVDEFLDRGVSWRTLRLAHQNARQLLKKSHPFCSRQFKTDGREIFTQIHAETGESALIGLSESQRVFGNILDPYLEDIDFDKDEPRRWWPLGRGLGVVIDPTRSYGKPIAAKSGVPTQVLAQAYEAEGSYKAVAAWYEVDEEAVRHAVQYERRPAA